MRSHLTKLFSRHPITCLNAVLLLGEKQVVFHRPTQLVLLSPDDFQCFGGFCSARSFHAGSLKKNRVFKIVVPSQKYRSAMPDSFLSACLPCLEKSDVEEYPGWILSCSASQVPLVNLNELPSAISYSFVVILFIWSIWKHFLWMPHKISFD